MLVAQAKAMALCHEMLPGAKIGPAPNISLVYPASCKPEDVLAAQNYNAIRNWLYLDMAVYGVYNNLVWAYLEENDACPEFGEGDAEALKNGHPDFIGFNYYNTATVEASDGTEKLDPGADQQTARGEAGVYRGYKNPNLPTTEFGWEIDPMGFRATIREMYSRYRLPMVVTENGLGAYDTLTEDGKVHDQYTQALRDQGSEVAGWRQVPTKSDCLGPIALASLPAFAQVFINGHDLSREQLAASLLIARRIAEKQLAEDTIFMWPASVKARWSTRG